MVPIDTEFNALLAQRVHALFASDSTGHDIWHIERVVNVAHRLAVQSGADAGVTMALAWLHECDDPKLCMDTDASYPNTRKVLTDLGMHMDQIDFMVRTLKTLGFRNALQGVTPATLEAQIVSDADYLDALGAVGIARCFAYGGAKGRVMFDPHIMPNMAQDAASYIKSADPSLNHFFEKLLTLKGRMYTDVGRAEASKRHNFMVEYLKQFFEETGAPSHWNAYL